MFNGETEYFSSEDDELSFVDAHDYQSEEAESEEDESIILLKKYLDEEVPFNLFLLIHKYTLKILCIILVDCFLNSNIINTSCNK